MANWRNAAVLGFGMMANYALLVVNFRMVAKGSYVGTALSDACIAWWNFTIVKRIHEANTRFEKLVYVLGRVTGSLIALKFTMLIGG
jgi:hypothetical protein